jgi:hypothetical protein
MMTDRLHRPARRRSSSRLRVAIERPTVETITQHVIRMSGGEEEFADLERLDRDELDEEDGDILLPPAPALELTSHRRRLRRSA